MTVGTGQHRWDRITDTDKHTQIMRNAKSPTCHDHLNFQVSDRGVDRRNDLSPHGGGNAAIFAAFCSDRPKQKFPTASAWLSQPGGDPGCLSFTNPTADSSHDMQHDHSPNLHDSPQSNTRAVIDRLRRIFRQYVNQYYPRLTRLNQPHHSTLTGRADIAPDALRTTRQAAPESFALAAATGNDDPTAKMLDYLIELVRETPQGESGGRYLLDRINRLSPTGRRMLNCHFRPQRLADIAADTRQSAARRLMAVRLLETGVNEHFHLRIEDAMVSLGKVTCLIIRRLTQQGRVQDAVDSLRLFAGLNHIDAARLVRLTTRLRC